MAVARRLKPSRATAVLKSNLSPSSRLLCFHSIGQWTKKQNKTKKPTLLEVGCVEICLNEVMSPSHGELLGAIHSTKIPTGPTGKSGPPQKVDPFFRNFSSWTEPIHWVLDRNFRKFWLNGSRPLFDPSAQSPPSDKTVEMLHFY